MIRDLDNLLKWTNRYRVFQRNCDETFNCHYLYPFAANAGFWHDACVRFCSQFCRIYRQEQQNAAMQRLHSDIRVQRRR